MKIWFNCRSYVSDSEDCFLNHRSATVKKINKFIIKLHDDIIKNAHYKQLLFAKKKNTPPGTVESSNYTNERSQAETQPRQPPEPLETEWPRLWCRVTYPHRAVVQIDGGGAPSLLCNFRKGAVVVSDAFVIYDLMTRPWPSCSGDFFILWL